MKKLLTLTAMITLLFAMTGCGGEKNNSSEGADPWLWLEEVEGEKALDWARAQNSISDEAFKTQPLYTELRDRFLEVFNDKERVIYPDMVGNNIYNLWQDEKNERGLWRRMSKEDFLAGKNDWEVVLDLDKLSAEENRKWVFGGASWLGPEDNLCLVYLSDGGKDESVIREFDASNKTFVSGGFSVSESKGSAAWIDKDNIIVATNYGPGTMTASGYPAVAKLWKRDADPAAAETLLKADTAMMGVFVSGMNVKGKQYAFLDLRKGFTTLSRSFLQLKAFEGLRFRQTRSSEACTEMMCFYISSQTGLQAMKHSNQDLLSALTFPVSLPASFW